MLKENERKENKEKSHFLSYCLDEEKIKRNKMIDFLLFGWIKNEKKENITLLNNICTLFMIDIG